MSRPISDPCGSQGLHSLPVGQEPTFDRPFLNSSSTSIRIYETSSASSTKSSGETNNPVSEKEMSMSDRKTASHIWALGILSCGLFVVAAAVVPLSAQNTAHAEHSAPSQLVEDVRNATRVYLDVNNAGPAGYGPAFGCVSGPDHGAMGIHYVNGALVGDGKIDKETPEALIYEPVSGGKLRLVGVEYIVDAATWLKNNNNTPPQLDGQAFQLVASPNRFGLDPFFELHVWAWRDNPQGAFVDWNNNVTCEHE